MLEYLFINIIDDIKYFLIPMLKARDADIGINGAIRYEILARGDDASSKFHIDPVSGIVRSMVTFTLDGGKLYGFDVKATDREGSETGNSAVTNIFVCKPTKS